MDITTETKLRTLLEAHPALTEYLVAYHPAFAKLRNPVLRATVLRTATIADAAHMAGLDPERLAADVRAHVASTSSATAPEQPPTPVSDKQAALKAIVHELHDGASVADVKARFDELVRDVDSTEIAEMEQALIAEGIPVEDIMRLCDVHVQVFKEALEAAPTPDVGPGHPVHTYRLENTELARIIGALRQALDEVPQHHEALDHVVEQLRRLAAVDVHYTRKENQLFPLLESHGVTGPTQVMWGIHDDIRSRLKTALAAAERGEREALATLPETLQLLEDMVYKEEHILFPVALETLSRAEWAAMAAGEPEIGYAWIEGPAAAFPAEPEAVTPADLHKAPATSTELTLTTGRLTLEQLDLMLRRLPVDVTFVDAEDRVRYYSEGTRVFPRSPAVIGRAVTNCHPPASVNKVVQILDAFRAGEKDVAEFWITLRGRFISIRYFALRDESGAYRGCLEVTQDLTDLRALEGERRLLDW